MLGIGNLTVVSPKELYSPVVPKILETADPPVQFVPADVSVNSIVQFCPTPSNSAFDTVISNVFPVVNSHISINEVSNRAYGLGSTVTTKVSFVILPQAAAVFITESVLNL